MAAGQRTFEGSCASTASPDEVWAAWTDPSRWAGGPIASAQLLGNFEVGGKIKTRARGYMPVTSTITRIDPPRLWTGVVKSPGLTMTIDHIVVPSGSGAVLTERALLSGPLAAVVARVLGRRLEATYAATTAHGAKVAEAQPESA